VCALADAAGAGRDSGGLCVPVGIGGCAGAGEERREIRIADCWTERPIGVCGHQATDEASAGDLADRIGLIERADIAAGKTSDDVVGAAGDRADGVGMDNGAAIRVEADEATEDAVGRVALHFAGGKRLIDGSVVDAEQTPANRIDGVDGDVAGGVGVVDVADIGAHQSAGKRIDGTVHGNAAGREREGDHAYIPAVADETADSRVTAVARHRAGRI
jgi:hypothetical protein